MRMSLCELEYMKNITIQSILIQTEKHAFGPPIRKQRHAMESNNKMPCSVLKSKTRFNPKTKEEDQLIFPKIPN